MKQLVFGTLLAAVLWGTTAWSAPEPMIVQSGDLWTVNVRFEPLKSLVVKDANDRPLRFWYSILTITNQTGQDVGFYPRCDLVTDTLQVVPAIAKTPRVLTQILQQRHRHKYPLLQSLHTVGNRILQGQDHAVDVLVVWPDFDPRAQRVSLYITGLSNETAQVDNLAALDDAGRPTPVYLRKTLELNFRLRSEAPYRTNADIRFADKRWVMR